MYNLKKKEQLFCEKYIAYGFNGTKAAMDSGFSSNPGSAAVQATRLLKKNNVKEYINELLEELKKEAQISAGSVLNGIKSIAYNPAAPHGTQLQAFKLLGDYLQLFKQEPQVIVNNITSKMDELTDEQLVEELAKLEEVDKDE